MPDETFREWLQAHKPGPFKPIPHRNVLFNSLVWFWKNERAAAEPIYSDGVWVGSIYRNANGEVVGVQIHDEVVK